MNAIHINWTKPFTNKSGRPYETEDFEILTTILSALRWREKNGKITMITDSEGEKYYQKINLTSIWDGVENILDDIDVNPDVFWAAGKIYALSRQSAPVAMIDTDFIVWETIDAAKDAAVIHYEDLYPDVYPGKEYFKMKDYAFDDEFDWSLKACNTAFCVINDEELLKYYCEQSINFMRHATEQADYLKYMVFAEQRLLPMCAKKLGKSISAFSDLGSLFGENEKRFTHTWGMKQQMRDNHELRNDFCFRCINRIVHEYPYMYDIMKNIENLKQYF
ncbi:MAG: hypothetical protein J1F01_10415 [Oscillospiraceae bacterium]|nr:hypothetical protein [Oscillospiraceae bacterium]